MKISLVTLIGNPKPRSRTYRFAAFLADRLISALNSAGLDTDHVTIDLAEIAEEIFTPDSVRVREATEVVLHADVLIVASPTYKATYTGLLKAFFDGFPYNGLAGTIGLPVMLGASYQHYLAIEHGLQPLLSELGAVCPVKGLYVLDSTVENPDESVEKWIVRASQILETMSVQFLADARTERKV